MKIITVPADVVFKLDGKPVEGSVSFKQFLIQHIDAYGETKTVSQLRQASKIIDKIEASNGTLSLEDSEYLIVKGACEKPVFRPGLGRQMLPYYDAVEQAKET